MSFAAVGQRQCICPAGVKSQKTDHDDSDDWDDDEDNDDGFTSDLLGLGKHFAWLCIDANCHPTNS